MVLRQMVVVSYRPTLFHRWRHRRSGRKMDQDIRLGKIAGIPVGINWSIL